MTQMGPLCRKRAHMRHEPSKPRSQQGSGAGGARSQQAFEARTTACSFATPTVDKPKFFTLCILRVQTRVQHVCVFSNCFERCCRVFRFSLLNRTFETSIVVVLCSGIRRGLLFSWRRGNCSKRSFALARIPRLFRMTSESEDIMFYETLSTQKQAQ